MNNKKEKVNLKFISILLLVVGIVSLLAAAYYSPYVQNYRYVKAWNLERQAKNYPAGSNDYARFQAMADAIRRGESTYTYTPNFNPASLPR